MNTYFVASDSYYKVKSKVNEILGNVSNVIKYDLRKDSIKDVIEEANYFSLTGEQKYLVVRCDSLLKSSKKEDSVKEDNGDIKLLEKYLNDPNEMCTIIFTSLVMPDKRKKIYKLFLEKGEAFLFEPLNKKDLVYECMNLLKNKKYNIDYETANYIVENSYTNYDIMLNELDKIYTLLKPQTITINLIKDIISIATINNTFSFIDAIIKRDLEKAYYTSQSFAKLKIDPTVVLIMLAKEFQVLLLIKSGISLGDIQKMLHKEDWQMRNYDNNARLYTENEIKKIIIQLNDYDYKLKSGNVDKNLILNLISLELCE